MAIHHKCCHVLGGSLGLPHGSVHSAMLAFSVAFNRDHAPAAMDRIRRALGLRADADIASEIFERVRASGATYVLVSLLPPRRPPPATVCAAVREGLTARFISSFVRCQ